MDKESTQEYIQIEIDVPRPYRWSTGKYLGKLYKEARDHKKLVTNRCPKCKELLYPPKSVCGRCNVEAGQDWVELGDKGTLIRFTRLMIPRWDPHRGEHYASPYTPATVLLDSGVYLRTLLEEKDINKLKEGLRVQAVWKEEGRGGGQYDIEYFRIIDEPEVMTNDQKS